MPIHDWSRVEAGLFHHFHLSWIVALSDALNAGLLPRGYAALIARAAAGPALDESIAPDPYAARANRIAIHHPLGKVVAVVEIVCPGNKNSRHALDAIVTRIADFLKQGVHALVIDLFPPGNLDPQGIHGVIWDALGEEAFELPTDKRLTLASYSAGLTVVAYVEPVAAGDTLPDMPLFLDPETYVPTPLEATYETTWSACPELLREIVLGHISPEDV